MTKRKTVSHDTIVAATNRMLVHLDTGTHIDTAKREAIIALTDSILLDGNSYYGFQFTNGPDDNTRKRYL